MAIDMLKIQPECVIRAMVIALLLAVLSIGMEMHRPSMMRRIRVAMLLLSSSLSIAERDDEAGRSHDAVIKWADS